MSHPITYYIDTPSVRVFLAITGDRLENLDRYELFDIITVLCQATSEARIVDFNKISTSDMVDFLDIVVSDTCQECINALDGFPVSSVDGLLLGLVSMIEEVK